MQEISITSAQLRAARALLNWTQGDLSKKTGISAFTIRRLEQSEELLQAAKVSTVHLLVKIFQDHGIEFINPSQNSVGVVLNNQSK